MNLFIEAQNWKMFRIGVIVILILTIAFKKLDGVK